jgi:hypothetical protein
VGPKSTSAVLVLMLSVAAFTGCSTPGAMHLYATRSGAEVIHDTAVNADDATQETPSFLATDDVLTGFAYDPFTDHFFLRLAPGDVIRVVDRPARKIKREFTIAGAPEGTLAGGGDIAVSQRDGHLYFISASGAELIETNRFGKFVQRVPLQGRTTAPAALAFDAAASQLLALDHDGRTIEFFTTTGSPVRRITLARAVEGSLAYDSDHHEIYALLAGTAGQVGVFTADGKAVRTLPIASDERFIDVGPHSFIRVF